MARCKIHLRVVRVPTRDQPGFEWTWQVRDHFRGHCCGTVKAGFMPSWHAAIRMGMRELERYLRTHCPYCGGTKTPQARHCHECQSAIYRGYRATAQPFVGQPQ